MRSLTADEAVERLVAGNQRFAAGHPTHPNQAPAARRALVAGQYPIATILACADSRVAPEIIFDQGLGDLFTIRVAGNIVDPVTLASLEFAAQHLDVPLVLVLGHSGCAAVQAAIANQPSPGHFDAVTAEIQPAVAQAAPGATLDQVVCTHVDRMVHRLRQSAPILAPLVDQGKIRIVGAHYDMASGLVELLHSRL